MMIDTKKFYKKLVEKNFDFFVGVPDSLLKEFCLCVNDLENSKHIIAANEGNAVAIASGYNISTGKYGVVYMQNSGLGNVINPLLSLADEDVYKIPMLFIIGYRGEVGVKDEPQHIKQGKLTLPLLDTLGVPYVILDDNYVEEIDYCHRYIVENNKSIAMVVRKDSFCKYGDFVSTNNNILVREDVLELIIKNLGDDDFIVSTTGKTSREIFEIREKYNMTHSNDFLTVGSMGHTSSLALGISLNTDKNIFCIDGDGSFIMHMGGVATAIQKSGDNFKYILINNGCHESVGGQKTIVDNLDLEKILLGFGIKKVFNVYDTSQLIQALNYQKEHGKIAIVVNTNDKSRKDLGRPTTTPIENKEQFIEKIRGKNESNNI